MGDETQEHGEDEDVYEGESWAMGVAEDGDWNIGECKDVKDGNRQRLDCSWDFHSSETWGSKKMVEHFNYHWSEIRLLPRTNKNMVCD